MNKNVKRDTTDKFAVVDTETNWNDEVMSIGVVVADSETWEKIDSVYYIIDPEYRAGGMYASELRPDEDGVRVTGRQEALQEIKQWLDTYHVRRLFAYNASLTRDICRNMQGISGMILCVWRHTVNITARYRSLRTVTEPGG